MVKKKVRKKETSTAKKRSKRGVWRIVKWWILVFILMMIFVAGAVIFLVIQNEQELAKGVYYDTTTGKIVYPDSVLRLEDLESGEVTVKINGKEVTYKAKYIVDGVSAVVPTGSGEVGSATNGEVVFLVVNGGKLGIDSGVVVSKINGGGSGCGCSGEATETVCENGGSDVGAEESEEGAYDYGKNAAIVVVGEESSVAIVNAGVYTASDGADAIVALESGSVVFANLEVQTIANDSSGLYADFGGKIVGNGGIVITRGDNSPMFDARTDGEVLVSGLEKVVNTETQDF